MRRFYKISPKNQTKSFEQHLFSIHTIFTEECKLPFSNRHGLETLSSL